MTRVLYAWELGENLGHVAAFLPVARALRDAGHEIVCAARETQAAALVLDGSGIPWLQAPRLEEVPHPAPPLSLPDLMARFGFGCADTLLGHVGAWVSVLRLARSQLVVADHAPSVLVAARILGLPAVRFGSSFCCPPATRPMPAMRPGRAVPESELDAIEQPVLDVVNRVLARFDSAPLGGVGELFATDETILLGVPELDHYPERAPTRYWGVIGSAGIGDTPVWPDAAGPKLFVYVRRGNPQLAALREVLRGLRSPTLVYYPDLGQEPAATSGNPPHLRVSSRPFELSACFRQADAAVTHGSLSTTAGFLLAGKPVLALPGHVEQHVLGLRVERAGLGRCFSRGDPAAALGTRLHEVLTDADMRRRCEAFAARYRELSQDRVVPEIARRIAEVAG